MPYVHLYVLGPPRLTVDNQRIDPGRRKSTALFVYLAVTERFHNRESLMASFFPDYDDEHARAGLRRILSSLKAVLPVTWLEGDRESIGIRHTPDLWVDVHRFHNLLAETRTHGHSVDKICAACLPILSEAVQLAGDEFLSGFTLPDCPDFDAWAHHQRELLRQELGGALERLTQAYCKRGEFDAAITYSLRQLQLDPLQEAVHRQTMRLYEWAGRHSDALRQFAACQQAFAQIGAQPEAETRQLFESIQKGAMDAWQPASSSVISATAPLLTDLPLYNHPFIGREAELTIIGEHLADPAVRLITLVGPGGMGKTRLAIRVGELVRTNFQHGVVFVPLAPVHPSDLLISAIAQAIGFTFYDPGDPKARLLRYVSDKQLLLILDSVEHLLDGAHLLAELLAYAPQVKLICTSRELLNVDGEWGCPILEMPYPRDDSPDPPQAYDAVKMFLQSAGRVQPDFSPPDHMAAVVRICQLVQGMPLALDLAAGWLTVLIPAEIADRLAGGLDLLTSSRRDRPPRQRAIRSVIDESWHMLSDAEHYLLMRLSLFRGGFSVDVLEKIVPGSLRELASLTHKAILKREASGRHSLHELLRQYAAERLADDPAFAHTVAAEFSQYYAAWMSDQAQCLHSTDQRQAVKAIDAEFDNVLVAWHWAAENGRAELLDRMRIALDRYEEARGKLPERADHLRAAVEALERQGGESARTILESLRAQMGRAILLMPQRHEGYAALNASLDYFDQRGAKFECAYAEIAVAQGLIVYERQYADAETHLQRSLEHLSGHQDSAALELRSEALFNLGRVGMYTGAYPQARVFYEESLGLAQRLGNPIAIAEALSGLGVLALIREQFDEAKSWLEEALVMNQRCDHKVRTARDLQRLAIISMRQGDYPAARDHYDQSLVLYRALGDCKAECAVLIGLGVIAYYGKEYDMALTCYRDALAAARELGDQEAIANCLTNIGIIYWEQGRSLPEAKRLMQESLSIHRANGVPSMVATTLQSLGVITYSCGEIDEAYAYLLEALRISVEIGLSDQLLNACSWLPFCLAHKQANRTAYALYLMLLEHPDITLDVPVWRKEVEPFLALIPPAVQAAVDANRDHLTLEGVIAEVLQNPPI